MSNELEAIRMVRDLVCLNGLGLLVAIVLVIMEVQLVKDEIIAAIARKAARTPTKRIEVEREADSRWIAEIMDCPGAMAYGSSPQEALEKALNISVLAAPDPKGE